MFVFVNVCVCKYVFRLHSNESHNTVPLHEAHASSNNLAHASSAPPRHHSNNPSTHASPHIRPELVIQGDYDTENMASASDIAPKQNSSVNEIAPREFTLSRASSRSNSHPGIVRCDIFCKINSLWESELKILNSGR